MNLTSFVLGRLGSRYSLTFDPHRKQVHYGALGLHCQPAADLLIALDDGTRAIGLPFADNVGSFDTVEQHLTMTGVRFVCHSLAFGIRADIRLSAPFYPRDEEVSTVPAYLIDMRLSRFSRIRWSSVDPDASRRATLRLRLNLPGATVAPWGVDTATDSPGGLALQYSVEVTSRFRTAEGGVETTRGARLRTQPVSGAADDRLVPLVGNWRMEADELRLDVDVSDRPIHARAALVGCCGDALFERFTEPMRLRYTSHWPDADAVVAWVREHQDDLLAKSCAFDDLFGKSDLPLAAQNTLATAFQELPRLQHVVRARGKRFRTGPRPVVQRLGRILLVQLHRGCHLQRGPVLFCPVAGTA